MYEYLKENPTAFSPDEVQILAAALDQAWADVRSRDPNISSTEARTALARLIVEHAKRGELDKDRLVHDVMERFRL